MIEFTLDETFREKDPRKRSLEIDDESWKKKKKKKKQQKKTKKKKKKKKKQKKTKKKKKKNRSPPMDPSLLRNWFSIVEANWN
ncbi:hypothetical protein V1477_016874 [Vespula maculifrons]|uniref:Uncharacterized protein n=1 Tax=Vespula maculifrons TaxID=7453 RepID=A0ABD2B4G8_VESMC